MTLEIEGKITEAGSDYDQILIGDISLAEFAEVIDGKICTLKYYISENPINKDTVVEDFLKSYYEGKTQSDGSYVSGSSWTGVYAKNDEFEVGGHDIIEELTSYLGKYCYLIVETKD